jgi:voltage-gated potassium channel
MKTPLQRIRNGAIVLGVVLVTATCGFRFFGGYDWIGAIWMVIVTISTVGHGEQSMQSPAMQIFTVFVIVLGMSASVYTVGGLIQIMLEGELERIIGTRRMNQELSKQSGHIIVCGFGRMGQLLSDELQHYRRPLVVVEKDTSLQADASNRGFMMFIGDATEEDVLTAVGIKRAQCLVSALPSDAENVFITLTARNLNPKLQIISRAEQQSTEKKLRQAGASRVVMPTVVGARQMARMITHPATADLMELVSQSGFEDLELDEILISEASGLSGVKVSETEAWRKHKLLVVAVKRSDGKYTFNPNGSDSFDNGDIVVVMGHGRDIQRFRKELVD